MGKEDRPKTNSLTHLAKALAREVVQEEVSPQLDNIKHRLTTLEVAFDQPVMVIDASKAMESIKNKLDKVGGPWPAKEQVLLDEELKLALSIIAANHGRTLGAIKARIDRFDLIKKMDH